MLQEANDEDEDECEDSGADQLVPQDLFANGRQGFAWISFVQIEVPPVVERSNEDASDCNVSLKQKRR